MNNRFQDANLRMEDFTNEVLVECPQCQKRAVVRKEKDQEGATLTCSECYYQSNKPDLSDEKRYKVTTDYWFGQELWLQASFKDELLWFHNYEHLSYVKQYITAGLRERNDRAFFTLVEKLPAFIKSAKNRERLVKLIEKLERK